VESERILTSPIGNPTDSEGSLGNHRESEGIPANLGRILRNPRESSDKRGILGYPNEFCGILENLREPEEILTTPENLRESQRVLANPREFNGIQGNPKETLGIRWNLVESERILTSSMESLGTLAHARGSKRISGNPQEFLQILVRRRKNSKRAKIEGKWEA